MLSHVRVVSAVSGKKMFVWLVWFVVKKIHAASIVRGKKPYTCPDKNTLSDSSIGLPYKCSNKKRISSGAIFIKRQPK